MITTNVQLLTENETASYIRMSHGFLAQDRMNGPRKNRTPGPPFIRLGKSIRYLKEDLDNWIFEHRVVLQLPADKQYQNTRIRDY